MHQRRADRRERQDLAREPHLLDQRRVVDDRARGRAEATPTNRFHTSRPDEQEDREVRDAAAEERPGRRSRRRRGRAAGLSSDHTKPEDAALVPDLQLLAHQADQQLAVPPDVAEVLADTAARRDLEQFGIGGHERFKATRRPSPVLVWWHVRPGSVASMRVAVDATPLIGPRTGIGRFVEALLPALAARGDVDVRPYVMSRRARDLPGGTKRVIVPAALAVRSWGRGGPSLAQLFPSAEVIHGTNQIAPPTAHTVVTVNDCSFVTARELCSPTVVSFGPVVRRVAASGGWIHAISEHVAVQARALFETDRVVAVPLGPPPPPPAGNASVQRARSVVAIGTLEPRKNFPRLVHAFKAVAAHDPEVTLTIAGADGPDSEHVGSAISCRSTRRCERECGSPGGSTTTNATGCSRKQACSRTRPSTRGSGFRCSRRGSATCPSSPRGRAHCPRSPATPRCSSIPSTSTHSQAALERALDDDAGARRARRPRPVAPRDLLLGGDRRGHRRDLPSSDGRQAAMITVLAGGVGAARFLRGAHAGDDRRPRSPRS